MGSHLDPNTSTSLGQRRPAASNLQFELPPPSNLQFAAQNIGHKFPPLQVGTHTQPAPTTSVGNLLTPPSNSASESGSSSANVPGGAHSNGHVVPVLPYTPTFWGQTPGGFGSGLTPQPWQNQSLYGPRSIYSPGIRNNSNSPAAGENQSHPAPPYEIGHTSAYSSNMGMPSPAVTSHASAAQHHHSQMMGNMMPVRPSSQASPISPADGVSKPSSTPSLYTPLSASNTPQPPQYGFVNATPASQNPHAGSQVSRISPTMHQGPLQQQFRPQFSKPPYPSYSLPAMQAAIYSNVQAPETGLQLVGNLPAVVSMGFHSGFSASPQQAQALYAQQRANSPQQPAANDRPFKCDQCPQSFNRNHDLKRHKRIHLAVKPFPCKYCDKSFSRKDALKRHILVKGCGNAGAEQVDGTKPEEGSDGIAAEAPAIAAVA